jgi:hypothetical protein
MKYGGSQLTFVGGAGRGEGKGAGVLVGVGGVGVGRTISGTGSLSSDASGASGASCCGKGAGAPCGAGTGSRGGVTLGTSGAEVWSGLLPFNLSSADAGTANPGDGGVDENPADTVLFVDTGEITRAGVVLRPPATGDANARDVQAGIAYRQTTDNVAVFTFRSLMVPSGTTLKLMGLRPVVIASATTIEIDGAVEARPMTEDGTICGPGASTPGGYAGGTGGLAIQQLPTYGHAPSVGSGPGGGAAGDSTSGAGGGGGGGHGGAGGPGCEDTDGGCAASGKRYDSPTLDVGNFRGGSGGGGGVAGSPIPHGTAGGGAGGPGGGAVRFVAVDSLSVGNGAATASVNGGGCGGAPGTCSSNGLYLCDDAGANSGGGGGGGAGGFVVLESPRVSLGAKAVVMVGGGSGGDAVSGGSSPTSSFAVGCFGRGPPNSISFGSGGGGNGGGGATIGPDGVEGEGPACAGGGGAGYLLIHSANPAIASGALLTPGPGSSSYSSTPLVMQ